MSHKQAICLAAALCLAVTVTFAQTADSTITRLTSFPSKFFSRVNRETSSLNRQLTRQTEKYLQRMARKEGKLRAELYRTDSAKAATLYPRDPKQQYAALILKFRQDSSRVFTSMGPEYLARVDSLQVALSFLNKNPDLVKTNPALRAKMQASLASLQQLQAKLQAADAVKQFIQSRKAQIQQTVSSFTHLSSGITNAVAGYKKQAYYYADQVRTYRAMLNDPSKMEQTALVLLNKVPAFSGFMKKNSFLAGLLGVPPDYGTSKGLEGLQTREQVMAMIQSKIGSSPAGAASLQNSINTAKGDIAKLQNKLGKLGGGSSGMDDVPDFKPSDQHSKTFLKRLQYGFNFQTTQGTYYFPNYSDVGLSLGYDLGHSNSVGIGASYKIGLGTGWQHIAFSSQGIGIRSYVDIHLKKSFSLTGGYELNYLQPFAAFKDVPQLKNWTQSGLIGIAKTISLKSSFFKKTQVEFLWDFLSYSQVPQQPPVIFRVGYGF
ncbi:MAG TPA: hypothetical protein VG101_03135 [Puia sp.]|jgi:hypothetical protein|nr:hypothetical protein [Puia sp.]